jgi:hypothetical protein
MLIDCDNCTVRGSACAGCVVSALLGTPELDPVEARAVRALIDGGLLAPAQRVVRVQDVQDVQDADELAGPVGPVGHRPVDANDRAPWPVDLPIPARRRHAG